MRHLEEIDISGCTSIEDCRINGMMNSALLKCNVRGSRVGVAYNNRWLEREPAEQVIFWLGHAIAPVYNGMGKELRVPKLMWSLVLEATITSKAECVALIWCLAMSNGMPQMTGQWKVEVWRDGRLVIESESLPSVFAKDFDFAIFYTLRRAHHVVQLLKLGDHIRVLQFNYMDDLAVVEGGMCCAQ